MAHSKAFSSNPGSRFRKFVTLAAQIPRVGSKKLLSNIVPTMPVFQRKIDQAESASPHRVLKREDVSNTLLGALP